MAFSSAALATEINTDPKGLGYASLVASHDRKGIALILNSSYSGVGTIWRNDLTAKEILACIVYSEVSGATAAQWTALSTLLIPGTVDASNANIRTTFQGMFATAAVTLANLIAAGKSVLSSRGEELFGYGTRITEQQVATALGA